MFSKSENFTILFISNEGSLDVIFTYRLLNFAVPLLLLAQSSFVFASFLTTGIELAIFGYCGHFSFFKIGIFSQKFLHFNVVAETLEGCGFDLVYGGHSAVIFLLIKLPEFSSDFCFSLLRRREFQVF
jgi:hypothetical protein